MDFNNLEYFGCHNHTDYSNFKGRDSICKVDKLIDTSYSLNYKGIVITDHECITSHVKALQHYNKKYKDTDFKVALGNEIYLVDNVDLFEAKNNNKKISYNHFILIAKNKKGYKQIRELSSTAWKNWFVRGAERTPITYDDLDRVIGSDGGNIIGSTACLGGYFPRVVLELLNEQEKENPNLTPIKIKINDFLNWGKNLFGDDFYIELQPNNTKEQVEFNKMALHLSKIYNIKPIITTDTHYLKEADKPIHKAFLQAEEGNEDRETEEFYSTTYLMNMNEMYSFFSSYMSEDEFKDIISNTMEIYNKIEMYSLEESVKVPNLKLDEFKLSHLFKDYYKDYPYIEKFAYSEYEQDRYYLYLIEKGFVKHGEEFNQVNLDRINVELSELWELSIKLNQRMSSYMNIVQKIVQLIWKTSLVGVSRGSVLGFYTAFLVGLVQLNPIPFDVPHWRFLSKERADGLPDIDIDSERKERSNILNILKDYFGEDCIVNIATIKSEGSKSAVLTCCRGMNINNDEASSLAALIKIERGRAWSIKDCLYGDKENNREPNTEFINIVNKYEGLREALENIEGLINGRSIHAAGVILYDNGYIEGNNAIMRSPNGVITTAYTMTDSEYVGNLKFDNLSIQTLDKIRVNLELLIKDGIIEYQGTLKDTYDKYLHPKVLDFTSKEIWELIPTGKVLDLFQFQTSLAIDCVKKAKPSNLIELAHVNSLLRLASDGEEQPIDQFVRYTRDISEWYKDMREYGLNEDEIKILEKHLLHLKGIASTQEDLMEMCMNPKIANFDLILSNKIRKSIAKKRIDLLEECKELFFIKGKEVGAREVFLNYI